ncbi:Conserved oligomeric Golgi complex [Trypanosoma melophagium]|uniref:Conserved oligomeric Golgi complex n=1 Tax=Trypanosoma melophagium TaxID=715481 RepID=UPI00351A7656|nr:Conserved oligomeric Golgi complex [Trypanosoma melophagium]
MYRTGTLEDRVELLLCRIAKGAEQRDAVLENVAHAVADTASLTACVDDVRTVSRRMLFSSVDSAAGLARTIAVSAGLAGRSSRRVKQLDLLLRRVRDAKTTADALREMRHTVARVNSTIDAGDLERTVQLLRKYEEASAHFGGPVPSALLNDDDEEESEEEYGTSEDENGMKGTTEKVLIGTDGEEGKYSHEQKMLSAEEKDAFSSTPGRQVNSGDDVVGGDNNNNNIDKRRNTLKGKKKKKGKNNKSGKNNDEAVGVISSAREAAKGKLLDKFRLATRANDKLTIMQTIRLLTFLGFRDEACGLYCTWICEHTIAALNKMVERELRKMDDPNEAGMSHLALVSTALDVVVAAFENEEEFMRETFGDVGLLRLLTELHSKSTSQCVPVLKDFLKKRQEVLRSVTAPASASYSDTTESDVGGGFTNLATPRASLVAVDPRRTDQILEEMAHLVSCCHLYWAFAQSKQQEYVHNVEEGGKQQQQQGGGGGGEQSTNDVMTSVDSLWSSRDNPLMNTVQEILAVFVPLQKSYFMAAFDQVLRLQIDALNAAGREGSMGPGSAGWGVGSGMGDGMNERTGRVTGIGGTSGVGGSNSSNNNSSKKPESVSSPSARTATNFMTGLAALYTSTGIATADTAANEFEQDDASQQVPITLPDDVFFFLRIAVHRAMNTKSTQIISAVFIGCAELVQSRVIPVLQEYTTLPPAAQLHQQQQQLQEHGYTIPFRVLRWTSAAQRTANYAHKLADELRQLTRANNFTGKDLLRFNELAEDMDVISRDLTATVTRWLTQYAELCYQAHIATFLDRFASLPYTLTEDVFYHYELSDPWVNACVAAATTALHPFDTHLDTYSFDLFLLALVRRVSSVMWQSLVQKSFSAYGALQVDREVRTLRTFFLGRAHEQQLREAFLPLTTATTLLLLDSPQDAELQDVGEGLTAEEKRRVLACRAEFNRAEIARVRL